MNWQILLSRNSSTLLFTLALLSGCSESYKARKMLEKGNYIELGIYCIEHYSETIQKECKESKQKNEEEIDRILAKKQFIPFGRVYVEKEKHQNISRLLRLDVSLGIRYRILWEEFTVTEGER